MVDKAVPAAELNDLTRFGVELREARQERRLTQKVLGSATGYSESYISKVEAGTVLASEKFAGGCDVALGTPGTFEELRERITKRGHPSWFRPYVHLEKSATSVWDYSPHLIMGALQTEAYARALFRAALPGAAADVVEDRVRARLERRALLRRADPPELRVLLNEACLRRPVGGPRVMAGQLRHLLAEAELPHVTVSVLPFAAGAPPAAEPFVLLGFADASVILYEEALTGGRLIDAEREVAEARAAYERLCALALPPAASRALIGEALAGLERVLAAGSAGSAEPAEPAANADRGGGTADSGGTDPGGARDDGPGEPSEPSEARGVGDGDGAE